MAALLFDLDGTLLFSDPLHTEVFIELLAEHGQQIDEAYYLDHLHGRLNADIFADLLPRQDPQAMSEEKEARFRRKLGDSVAPMPGVLGVLAHARARNWAVGVVTNAPRINAEAMLKAIGLADAFDTLVIGDECERGKPHPAPYLTGLARLGADPATTLAFEDSTSGAAAARAAGIYTYGIRSSLGDPALRAAGADATIADFTDPALWDHLGRLEGQTP
jgi:HAD superfamily hydrolase (TIGR01509 family)